MDIFLLVSSSSGSTPIGDNKEGMGVFRERFSEKRSRSASVCSPARSNSSSRVKRIRGSPSRARSSAVVASRTLDPYLSHKAKPTDCKGHDDLSAGTADPPIPVIERLKQAKKRRQDHLQSKKDKARFDDRVRLAKERRNLIDMERKLTLETHYQLRSTGAVKRAEQNIKIKVTKTRLDERLTKAHERRSNLESERRSHLHGEIFSRSKKAALRAQSQLQNKIAKAQYADRIYRARQRRTIVEYERRAALLPMLDHRTVRAANNADAIRKTKQRKASEDVRHAQLVAKRVRAARIIQREVRHVGLLENRSTRAEMNAKVILEGKQKKAREDVRHAQTVAKRVRAARVVQRTVRHKYGFASGLIATSGGGLSQNEAAVRIQTWKVWRFKLAARLLLADHIEGEQQMGDVNRNTSPMKALRSIMSVFDERNSFDQVRILMQHSSTLGDACTVLESLRPILRPFKNSDNHTTGLNDRTLLSALLIATHPREVLGGVEEGEAISKLVEWSSKGLFDLLRALSCVSSSADFSSVSDKLIPTMSKLGKKASSYVMAFQKWKDADLNSMLSGMTKAAEQSWVVYLSASETLSYLGQLHGINDETTRMPHDQLISIRLRHEASKSGSRSHLKRIRLSLNKLVGKDEGLQIMKDAKSKALSQMESQQLVQGMKADVDQLVESTADCSPSSTNFEGHPPTEELRIGVTAEETSEKQHRPVKNSSQGDGTNILAASPSNVLDSMPDGFMLSNEQLVHTILQTDPSGFHTLTWDGSTNFEGASVQDFMSTWENDASRPPKPEQGGTVSTYGALSVQDRISRTMTSAYFGQVVDDIRSNKLASVQALMKELHEKMRQLIPNRKDLHCHLQDDDIVTVQTSSDVIRVLVKAGEALACHLEAPARAASTSEWRSAAICDSSDASTIPFGFQSWEQFAVASVAFLLHKVDLCKADICNAHLLKVAPLVHQIGHDFERSKFEEKYCKLDAAIDNLTSSLPATTEWLRHTLASAELEREIVSRWSYERRMTMLKTQGVVDGLLFASCSLAIPEVLAMDTERIMKVRDEARYAVIGSALGLHACNATVGAVTLCSSPLPDVLLVEKNRLSCALRTRHASHDSLVVAVSKAVSNLAGVLNTRPLDREADSSLRNTVAAVLRGEDPVLKLLDNRVRQLFRFMCKWQKPASINTQAGASTIPMRTGRSVLKGDNSSGLQRGSTLVKDDAQRTFLDAVQKEASKRGFALFAVELAEAGDVMRRVVDLSCSLYGRKVLDRLILSACGTGSDTRLL